VKLCSSHFPPIENKSQYQSCGKILAASFSTLKLVNQCVIYIIIIIQSQICVLVILQVAGFWMFCCWKETRLVGGTAEQQERFNPPHDSVLSCSARPSSSFPLLFCSSAQGGYWSISLLSPSLPKLRTIPCQMQPESPPPPIFTAVTPEMSLLPFGVCELRPLITRPPMPG
jgi:hypothetical protein